MKKIIIYFLVVFISVCCSEPAFSDVPMEVSLQGVLTDANGDPKPDGEYEITIRLYNSAQDGEAFYETTDKVSTLSGVFSLTMNLEETSLDQIDADIWAGIQLSGENEMEPRLKMSSVPFGIRAAISDYSKNSDHAGTADTSSYARAAETSDTSLYSGHARYSDTCDFSRNSPDQIPIGCIMPFAGIEDMIPEKWMICDGKALRSSEYELLFKVISKSWGDGSGDRDEKTDFNLPDLRGLFIRGVDQGAGVDPDADSRMAIKPGGNEGDKVGSVQLDAAENTSSDEWDFCRSSSMNVRSFPDNSTEFTSYSFKTGGGSETRPVNAYVYFIIKVK